MMVRGRLVKTVKELREYLDALEAEWTEQDTEYLGGFESQELWVPYFDQEGNCEGYSHPAVDTPAWAAGTIVFDRPKEGTEDKPVKSTGNTHQDTTKPFDLSP